MSTDLRQLAEESYERARDLRAREENLTGRKRGRVRQFRHLREEESRLAQDLLDLRKRIRHLEQKQEIKHGTKAGRNGSR